MRRSTVVLVVLLGASLLVNAMLTLRLFRTPDPDPSTVCEVPVADRSGKVEDRASLQPTLDQERKKNEELHAKIERLEIDKKVLAQEVPGAGGSDKLAIFRTKLRKFVKVMKGLAAKAGAVDSEDIIELTEITMEGLKMAMMRAKEPKVYANHLQVFFEVSLEGEGTSLDEAQGSTLAKLFQGFGQDLSKISPTPTGERLLKEIELESAIMSRIDELLTEPQRTVLSKRDVNLSAMGNMFSTSFVSKTSAVDQIAREWSTLYQLDPAQLPQAKIAAQAYVDAISRANDQNKSGSQFDQQGTPQEYEFRLRSVGEQLAALNMLQAWMTPAQQERMRTQTMREIRIIDAEASIQSTPFEK